jgi:FtsZ-binding cell division protein ZapB
MTKNIIYIGLISLLLVSCGIQKEVETANAKVKTLQKDIEKLKSENESLKTNVGIYKEQTQDLEQRIMDFQGGTVDAPAADMILNSAEEMPSFAKENSFNNFIKKNMKQPQSIHSLGADKIVYIEFVVETDGSLSYLNIVKKISPEVDLEAKRLIKLSQNWTPGKINGEPVRVRMVLPINFEIQ